MSERDRKDLGFPPELADRTPLTEPAPLMKWLLLACLLLFAGLAAVDVAQQIPLVDHATVMASAALHALSWPTVAGVLCSLLVAGIVKGAIGVGMPIIGFPLLTAFVNVRTAVMLLSIPLVLSNIPQALEGEGTGLVLKDLAPIFIGTVPGVLFGVHLLVSVNPHLAQIIAGAALIFVVGLVLCAPKLSMSPRVNGPASLLVGVASGVLGGVAAVSGPLVFSFLLAKGLRGKLFTKYASAYLVISSVLLSVILAANKGFGGANLLLSFLALVPVALGMVFGQQLRDRISTDRFKVAVLVVVMASGLDLIRRGAGF